MEQRGISHFKMKRENIKAIKGMEVNDRKVNLKSVANESIIGKVESFRFDSYILVRMRSFKLFHVKINDHNISSSTLFISRSTSVPITRKCIKSFGISDDEDLNPCR